MRIRKYGLFAAMLAAGACLLSGCGQVDDSVFESTADFSVNISVPFATTEPDEIAEEDRAQVEIDANGNVTVNDSSLLNSSYTRQTNDDELNTKPWSSATPAWPSRRCSNAFRSWATSAAASPASSTRRPKPPYAGLSRPTASCRPASPRRRSGGAVLVGRAGLRDGRVRIRRRFTVYDAAARRGRQRRLRASAPPGRAGLSDFGADRRLR